MKQKADHSLILLFFQQGQSYTDIAKKVGISKQRVYQIIRKNSLGKKGREEKYETLGGICASCGSEATLLHHIDGDFNNDNIENLIPLCSNCHGKVHGINIKKRENIENKNLKDEYPSSGRITLSMPEPVYSAFKKNYKKLGYTTLSSFVVRSAIENLQNNQINAQNINHIASSGSDFSLKEDHEKDHDHNR